MSLACTFGNVAIFVVDGLDASNFQKIDEQFGSFQCLKMSTPRN